MLEQLGSIATAIGVMLGVWQLRRSAIQARTDFEDRLADEYRTISRRLPIEALLGDPLPPENQSECLPIFYQYIDLSNEQVFLRQTRRISKQTWRNWRDGIRSHLNRPAFEHAWSEIKRRAPNNFAELKKLERSNYEGDPATWTVR